MAATLLEDQDVRLLFVNVLERAKHIPTGISEGKSDVQTPDLCDTSLTEFRVHLAFKVLSNIFAYRNYSVPVLLSSTQTKSDGNILVKLGPVLNKSGKKDTTTTFQEYARLRQIHIKSREQDDCCESAIPAVDHDDEAEIVKAVVSYDFLHSDIAKPVHSLKLGDSVVDSSFKAAVKILYNRSRIASILTKFEDGVKSNLYPALPDLNMADIKLLEHEGEIKLVTKYIQGFFPFMDKLNLDGSGISKIIPKIWQFLLFLSQDYSVYYNQVRTLCDEHTLGLYATMHARIHMLKVILAIYDGAFVFLNLKPLSYM